MKVLEKGKLKVATKKVKCSKCSSKLEYTEKDVHGDFRDGDFITCPVCKSFIAVGNQPDMSFDRSKDC